LAMASRAGSALSSTRVRRVVMVASTSSTTRPMRSPAIPSVSTARRVVMRSIFSAMLVARSLSSSRVDPIDGMVDPGTRAAASLVPPVSSM